MGSARNSRDPVSSSRVAPDRMTIKDTEIGMMDQEAQAERAALRVPAAAASAVPKREFFLEFGEDKTAWLCALGILLPQFSDNWS